MDFFNQPDSSPVRETSPELEGASEAETWDHGTQGSWLDEEAVKPFNEPNKASKLCHACLPFFTFGKKPGESHRHLRFRSSLQAALRQGCHLCAVVWNKIQLESVGREAPAKIELTYWLTTDLGPGCELHVSFQVYRCTNGQQNQLGRGSAEFRFALPKGYKT